MDKVLACEGLVKRFDELTAVGGVSLDIAAGETYGLLGPNGAGKTTTISMICGLLERDAGTVHVAGEPIDVNTVAARAAIGYVPQEIAVYPDLTGRENLRFFGRLNGLERDELDRRVDEVLEIVGLTERAKDKAEEYSGGMQRRLNIGAGMLHHPKLLILDEPTVGVDPQSRNAILDSVEDLGGEGMAVLYTTHYMEEAERLCDRVGIIDNGTIVAEGTRRELTALVGSVDTVVVDVTGGDGMLERLSALDGVVEATLDRDRLTVLVPEAGARLAELLAAVSAGGASVRGVQVTEPDLEAVFLHLTGKALRD
ncbi:MAG: ABC transporter ATP-binding protein [Acidimicrobiia bacterium]